MSSLRRRSLWVLPICLAFASCLFDSHGGADRNDPILDPEHSTSLPVSQRMMVVQIDPTSPNRFRFEAREGESYRIEGQALLLSIRLFDEHATPLPLRQNPAHNGRAVETAPLHAGTHYIVLDLEKAGQDADGPEYYASALRIIAIAGGIPVDSFETDNRFSEAKELMIRRIEDRYSYGIQVRTLHRSDTDWVKFQADSGWRYLIDVERAPSLIQLVDSQGMLLDTASTPESRLFAEIAFDCRRNGTQHLRITAIGPTRDRGLDSGAYNLTIRAIPIELRAEPVRDSNNSVDSGTPLPVANQWTTAAIDHPGDQDWYRFSAIAGRRYLIETVGASAALRMDSRLGFLRYGYLDRLDSSLLDGDTARIDWMCPADGEYHIRAQAADTARTGLYRIAVRSPASTPKFDRFEPDDDLETAKFVSVEGTVQSRSFHPGDTDIVQFKTVPGVAYAIDLEGPPDAQWKSNLFAFFGLTGNWSFVSDSTARPGTLRILFLYPAATTNFMAFYASDILSKSWSSTPGAIAQYRISIHPLHDSESVLLKADEPDGGLRISRPLAVGSTPLTGALLGTDQDWFQFQGEAGKTYSIEMRTSEMGAVYAELFHANWVWNDARGAYDSVLRIAQPMVSGPVSQFIWTCPWSMTVYLRLINHTPLYFARYSVAIREMPPSVEASPAVPVATPSGTARPTLSESAVFLSPRLLLQP